MIIKRELFEPLKEHLRKDEITLIVGPRQAGKTTLMLLLKEELERRKEKTVFLNLDIENDRQFFSSQASLVQKIELELGKAKGFVFIDEIQRKENAGLFLKGIYDMNLPYKFIVSGSGSVELKEKIHESLAGRKRIFELSTLSFEEFVNFKTEYRYEQRLNSFFAVEKQRSLNLLEEYLNFGGYPRVVLASAIKEKKVVMEDIYRSFVEKDIYYLLKVEKEEVFSNLVRLIASQTGMIVNYAELSSTLGISYRTLRSYLWYLEKTFILDKVTPFFKNTRKEITKSPVFYFIDLGMRNFANGSFDWGGVQNADFVFQNFIYNILSDKLKEKMAKINFWRTKDGAEVDFVVLVGSEEFPIEVKNRHLEKVEGNRSLMSYIEKYHPKKAIVVNLSLQGQKKVKGTQLIAIPYWFDFTKIF